MRRPLVSLASALLMAPFLVAPSAPAVALTSDQQQEAINFTAANAAFFAYHEAAHALIATLNLPVIGREEDAADMLAASIMIPAEGGDDTRDQKIMDAIDGFALVDGLAGESPGEEDYMDEHGLDAQRYYQMACLLYGSDPDGFAEYAEAIGLTEDRLSSCPDEYKRATQSWQRLLAPYQPKGGASNAFNLAWDPQVRGQRWTQAVRQARALEQVVADLNNRVFLPKPITMTVTACGDEVNAWWDPESQSITICAELIELFGNAVEEDILAQGDDANDSRDDSSSNTGKMGSKGEAAPNGGTGKKIGGKSAPDSDGATFTVEKK